MHIARTFNMFSQQCETTLSINLFFTSEIKQSLQTKQSLLPVSDRSTSCHAFKVTSFKEHFKLTAIMYNHTITEIFSPRTSTTANGTSKLLGATVFHSKVFHIPQASTSNSAAPPRQTFPNPTKFFQFHGSQLCPHSLSKLRTFRIIYL